MLKLMVMIAVKLWLHSPVALERDWVGKEVGLR